MTTMQGAFYTRRGPAREVLQIADDLPIPEPAAGEVRVRVVTSGINPSDVKGRRNTAMAMVFPRVVPHQDGSGVVDAVGAGVPEARIGQRVWMFMSQIGSPHGTAAQYNVLPAWRAVPLPDGSSFDEGAMLGVPALTAHYALFDGQALAGQRVLVQGGAGAVGFYAIQMARLAGAGFVAATVSRDEQAAEARRAGADLVINRREQDVVAVLRERLASPQPIDRVVEVAFGANQASNLALLANNGVIAAYGSDASPEPPLQFWPHLARDTTLRMLLIYLAPRERLERAAAAVNGWMSRGLLQHHRALVHPLTSIAAAHDQVEAGGHIGKVLLRIAEA